VAAARRDRARTTPRSPTIRACSTNRDRVEHRALLEGLLAERFVRARPGRARSTSRARAHRVRRRERRGPTSRCHPALRRATLPTAYGTVSVPAPPAIVDGATPLLGPGAGARPARRRDPPRVR
jgi:hypothetical protein